MRGRWGVHLQHDQISVFVGDFNDVVRITRDSRRDYVDIVALEEGFGFRPR